MLELGWRSVLVCLRHQDLSTRLTIRSRKAQQQSQYGMVKLIQRRKTWRSFYLDLLDQRATVD